MTTKNTVNTPIQSIIYSVSVTLIGFFFLFIFTFSFPKHANSNIEVINHVVIIYLENHSFDNLYGEFEGANGLSNASASSKIQIDSNGRPFEFLPPINGTSAFPVNLPNTVFNIDQYIPNDQLIPDVLHRFYQEQLQIDHGRMDQFALYNNSAGLSQGYYKTSLLPLAKIAGQYTVCDNFFHSAFGGSFLNHIWLVAAASPEFANAPASMLVKKYGRKKGMEDGTVTSDGYVINTAYSVNHPRPVDVDTSELVPNQNIPTIGDRLDEKKISWAWYSGGWNDALDNHSSPYFQYNHQPFIYFSTYADGTLAKKEHLKDELDFIASSKNGTLPSVSFVKPIGIYNEHPGYSDLARSEMHTLELINDVMNGPNGQDALIIVTYDENGGFWDHVAPPVKDNMGPGTRVPTIIISPFAKKRFVDHTEYETVSILSFIEKRWNLKPLSKRDKNANPLSNAFIFPLNDH